MYAVPPEPEGFVLPFTILKCIPATISDILYYHSEINRDSCYCLSDMRTMVLENLATFTPAKCPSVVGQYSTTEHMGDWGYPLLAAFNDH